MSKFSLSPDLIKRIMKIDTVEDKINFINNYMVAQNAATGSEVDQNANVTRKNIATMAAELPKKDMILLNRVKMYLKLTEMYDEATAIQYIIDLNHHIIYNLNHFWVIVLPFIIPFSECHASAIPSL